MRLRRADHVEVAVGREVGSELVRYVFDFGKYYAALTDTFVYRAGDVVGGQAEGRLGMGLAALAAWRRRSRSAGRRSASG